MNTSKDKADFNSVIASKLNEAHDALVKSVKLVSILGAFCGFIYLLSYTTHVGIPFPLELSVLPTTLLIVGLTSLVGTFIIVAGMFLPVLTLDYNDEITKGYRRADDEVDLVASRFTRYFFCTWMPTAFALLGMVLLLEVMGNEIWLKFLGAIVILISVGYIAYTPKYVDVFVENRLQYFIVNVLQVTLSVFAYSLIIVISVAVFPEIGKWPGWAGCLLTLVLFTVCQIVIFVPSTNSENGKILLPPNFKKKTTPPMGAAFLMASVFTIFTVTMPQVNYKIGGAALRAFHVGGSVPVAICLKTKPPEVIGRNLRFDTDFCSEPLSMKLDSGDRVYVSKFVTKKDSVPRGNHDTAEAIYFRQDEIRQKIYYK